MTKQPTVSVIVPSYNSSATLAACLQSIRDQSYDGTIELIVVDNNSKDDTKAIAKTYTKLVFNKGPERSAQVNYGVEKAAGEYVYKVDSDFVVDSEVVAQCVEETSHGFDAVVVHNSPDVRVSWIAKVRKFEVDMYKYDIVHSSARFVKKSVYQAIGGFNSAVTAGEDYDFQNKLNRGGYTTSFIEAEALHLGEPKQLVPHLKKYYDYGKDFVNYVSENKQEVTGQIGPIRTIYIKNWKKFLDRPITGAVFLVYNLLKYIAGGMGFVSGKLTR